MTHSRGWPQLAAAALLGILSAFGQAPYDLPVLLLAGFAAIAYLFGQASGSKRAFWLGWAFGLGYFAHTLQWIVSPFMVDAARHGWMAPFAVSLMAAGLALFWGVAFWAARLMDSKQRWPLILCFAIAELARAYVFTGFPWGMPSQAMVDVAAGQSLAWIGPYGLNLLIVAVAACLGTPVLTRTLRLGQIAIGLAALAVVTLPPFAPEAELTGHRMRLIQPNVPQKDKWDPEKIPAFFERHLSLTSAPPIEGQEAPDLVLWSETAIPWRLDYAGSALQEVARASEGAPVALGVQRVDEAGYFNSLVVLDAVGLPGQLYDKHHLVPFGEYVPLAHVLNRLGVFGLAQQVPTGYARGPGARLLDFGDMGRALPLICYEAVFPHDVNAAPERPDFLVQITNDAWFGRGAGPRQHLAQARMRAIEQGLPLARSANTGISAMIDPYGRILDHLPLNSAGFLDVALPKALSPTPYARTGDLPFAIALSICGLIAALRPWQARDRLSS